MTAYRLLVRILVGVTALLIAGILLDTSLPIAARIVGVCLIALFYWGYWNGWLPPG